MQLKDLEKWVIPVEPLACKPYRINCHIGEGNIITRTVQRHQFPMTPAYAFTDYCSQGQTIANVIVDIATPPTGRSSLGLFAVSFWQKLMASTGGLSLFNLYVALSRSSGRSSIRLLRDFDIKVFQAGHCPELLAENDRLEELNEVTLQEWKSSGRDTRSVQQ